MVRMLFKSPSFYLFRLSAFHLFSVLLYDSNWYVSVLAFSYFSLILSIWKTAKHNSKLVSHQIRSQDDKLYCTCEDSCSRLYISARKQNHFHFENFIPLHSQEPMGILYLQKSQSAINRTKQVLWKINVMQSDFDIKWICYQNSTIKLEYYKTHLINVLNFS